MKKNRMSLCILLTVLLALGLSSCGSTGEQQMSFKEAVDAHQIWFAGTKEIEKNKSPNDVIIFYESTATKYSLKNCEPLTFGEIATMSDDEIIGFLESNCPAEDIKEFDKYECVIRTDSTGNNTICEYVNMHIAGYPEDWSGYYEYPDDDDENCYISSQQIYDSYFKGFFRSANGSYESWTPYFVTKCSSDTVLTYDQPGTPGVTER